MSLSLKTILNFEQNKKEYTFVLLINFRDVAQPG